MEGEGYNHRDCKNPRNCSRPITSLRLARPANLLDRPRQLFVPSERGDGVTGKAGNSVMIVGAGASGRGHVGQLAFESGYRLAFLDTDRKLRAMLRDRGSYEVRLVSAHPRTVTVRGFSIHHPEDADFHAPFAEAKLLFTAVCPENLAAAADELRPLFVRWLRETGGKPAKNIFCCENMNRGTSVFRAQLEKGFPAELLPALDRSVGFPDTMIARVVTRPHDPLSLLGEEYSEWTADRSAIRGTELPRVKTLELVEGQERYLQRKLYIHNTGHATLGYLGFLKGLTWVHEAGQDPDIMDVCERAIEESGWAIQREHGFPPDVIRDYRRALTEKCVLPQLPDELARVVRDPVRKLGPEERFFGPARLMIKHGRDPHWLLYGAAAALAARIPGDASSAAIGGALASGGVAGALRHCGVDLPQRIVDAIERLVPEVRERFPRMNRGVE
jgi:mannitol-1-phosphate 5-dehydrogenase